jgi:uncharacterized membrane protein
MQEIWTFLFKYPPYVFERGQVVFASPLGSGVLLLAVAVAGAAVWTYVRGGTGVGRADRVLLITLRTGLLAVLLFVLFRPALHLPLAVPQANYLAVLIDDSRSMRIADDGDVARGDRVLQSLESGVLDALGERFRLRLFRFSGNAEPIVGTEELSFGGGQTRIGRGLDYARSTLSGMPLAGMVVITDGGDAAEAELNASLLGLRSASIPVYTVGVGRESFDRDIEVRRVAVPRSVLRGTSLTLDVTISQTGYRGQTVPLIVEDEGRIVTSTEVQLPPNGTPAAVQVHYTATEPGWRRLRFRVPVQEGEQIRENNQREELIEVREGPHKILYVEGEPRFEVSFMRRAVADDPELQLVVLQRTARDRFLRLNVNSAEELASGFPNTREELFEYHGIILGSVEAGFFTSRQLRLLNEFVSERGGGLMMLGGRRSFSEGGYAGTPVADVLPLELETQADTGYFAEVEVVPTRAGELHPALRLDEDLTISRERWASLPPLTTFNRATRLKPGATALLAGAGNGVPQSQVVLAYQRYGRGLALSFAVQDVWLWQMHADIPVDDPTHQTLWRQLLRWLVNDSPQQLDLAASAEPAGIGQPVAIRTRVHDSGFRRISNADVVAEIETPDGNVHDLAMRWSARRDGEYEATFAPSLPGLHRIRTLALRGDSTVARGQLVIPAVEDTGEFFESEMRAPLLRRIAEESGGRFYTLDELDRLPQEVRYSGQGVTTTERYDLWDMPAVFFLLLALLFAEWGYRRKRGLP